MEVLFLVGLLFTDYSRKELNIRAVFVDTVEVFRNSL